MDVFWKCLDQNPGPIFAAIVFLAIVERECFIALKLPLALLRDVVRLMADAAHNI